MKKSILFFMALIMMLSLCACENGYNNKESEKFVSIPVSCADTINFINSINKYANTIEKGIMLGSIQVIYRNDINLYDNVIIFHYSRTIDDSNAISLDISYSTLRKGVISSNCIIGTSKVTRPYTKALKFHNWKLNFAKASADLSKTLKRKGITSFYSIVCYCYDSNWKYNVFKHKNDSISDSSSFSFFAE